MDSRITGNLVLLLFAEIYVLAVVGGEQKGSDNNEIGFNRIVRNDSYLGEDPSTSTQVGLLLDSLDVRCDGVSG